MLLRQTALYLPAQLLPAAAQLVSLLVWAHLAGAAALGVVTLFVAVQELLIAALLLFWNVYIVRYGDHSGEALRRTTTVVVGSSILLQTLSGLGFFLLAIDQDASAALLLILAIGIASRALNNFQAERARSRADIPLYSVLVILGPVAGLLLSVLLLTSGEPHYFDIFLALACAQGVSAAVGLIRDGQWIGWGKPDMTILQEAFRYGGPLALASLSGWVTQNATRLSVAFFIGFAATGIYSLGFGLGFRAASVAAMSVAAAAFPLAVRLANAGEKERALDQLASNGALLIAIMLAASVGLLLTGEDILRLSVDRKIAGTVYQVMMWTLLGGTLNYIRVHFLNQVFLLRERPSIIAYLSVSEAAIGAAAALLIVPSLGLVAGAAAFAGNSLLFLMLAFVASRRQGLRLHWHSLSRAAVATAAMATVLLVLPPSLTALALLIKIMAGGGVFLVVAGLLHLPVIRRMAKGDAESSSAESPF